MSLSKNDFLRFNLSESYKVYILDYGIYDQDKIELKINNKVSEIITIEKNRYYFDLNKNQQKDIIKIKGVSKGTIPPITSLIVIENTRGKILNQINLKLNEDDICKLEINF